MGWMNKLLNRIAGVAPTDWTFVDNVPDPGLGVAGKAMVPDLCYVELYVESLRLEKARRFATSFHGVIYSFASLARNGSNRAELASVTKPQNLATLDSDNLDRVITVSKRLMSAMPWRGDPFGLELGLFSVKSGNLLSPLVDYVTKISDKAGISALTKLDPFTPLITEGLDMIAGQTKETEIELALDTDMSLSASRLCALIAIPKDEIKASDLRIDPADRKLLHKGQPLQAAYCLFSVRSRTDNPDWGTLAALRQAYEDFTGAIVSGKRKDAEEALAAFNRQLIISPDLITKDKESLRDKAKEDLKEAFPAGGQSATPALLTKFKGRTLADLNLYGE